MEPVDVLMRRQRWEWIGHNIRKDEKCIARKAMEWNPLLSAGRLPGRHRQTWRRTVARESKIICKTWNELKALAHNRTHWTATVIPMSPWNRGYEEEDDEYIFCTYTSRKGLGI